MVLVTSEVPQSGPRYARRHKVGCSSNDMLAQSTKFGTHTCTLDQSKTF